VRRLELPETEVARLSGKRMQSRQAAGREPGLNPEAGWWRMVGGGWRDGRTSEGGSCKHCDVTKRDEMRK